MDSSCVVHHTCSLDEVYAHEEEVDGSSNTENNPENNPDHNTERSSEQRIAFPRLGEDDIAELEEIGSRRHLQDGEVLFEAGEERCGFFVVLSGAIKVVDGSGDAAQVVSVHEPGEFTGDVDVLGARRAIVSAVAEGADRGAAYLQRRPEPPAERAAGAGRDDSQRFHRPP